MMAAARTKAARGVRNSDLTHRFAAVAKHRVEVRILIVGSYFETPLSKLWPRLKVRKGDWIIAVDGGLAELKRIGVQADAAVGDWDSLSQKRLLEKVPHLTLRKDKDRSDLFYGLALALGAGATEITCVGVTGGRPDHHLATLFDLTEIAKISQGVKTLEIVDGQGIYRWVSPRTGKLQLPRGASVAVFSMDGVASGVTIQGTRYKLRNAKVEPSSLGISNRVTTGKAFASVNKGVLLVWSTTSRA